MTKYVAFLRAINVGGTKIIKMEDLRKMFESFGYADVQTYIQSGNVIFEAKTSVEDAQVEKRLEKALGYKVEVFVRTMDEVRKIAVKLPFEPKENETLHVVFTRRQVLTKASEQNLLPFRGEPDDFTVKGDEVYNLRRDRDKSIFSNNFIEKTLKIEATTRNITTIRKIINKFGEE